MTDFDYDCYLKKQVAHSAVRKKNGSRSKRCTLPSDNLTNAQKKKLNGKVVTYQMGKPMTWQEYKDLPDDLKKQYLDDLISKYDVGAKQIADMFGVSGCTLGKHLPVSQGFSFRRAHRMNRSMLESWNRFLAGEPEEEALSPELCEDRAQEACETPAASADTKPISLAVNLSFSGGDPDPNKIADSLAVLKCLSGVEISSVFIRWIKEKEEGAITF